MSLTKMKMPRWINGNTLDRIKNENIQDKLKIAHHRKLGYDQLKLKAFNLSDNIILYRTERM